jgi:hypothetical protein
MLVEITYFRNAHSISEETPPVTPAPENVLAGTFIRTSRAVLGQVISGPGLQSFTDLQDVPHSYVGEDGKLVAVATGGGLEFIAPPVVLDFIDSVVESGGDVSLENDSATPGNNKVYGTNGAGARGWKADPVIPTPPNFIDSIVESGGDVSLDGDESAPGVNMSYGTDNVGVRGWVSRPTVIPTGNFLVSGGGVAWTGTGFDYRVSAAVYVIAGVQYSSPETVVTLAAADPTDDRIDVIVVNTSSVVAVITGTPGGPPVEPSIDPTTELKVGFVKVPPGEGTPVITSADIHKENTEWTTSVSGGTINAASTNNPFAGTKDIEATSAANGHYVNLANPGSPVAVADYDSLIFQIRSKASWPNQKSISIFFNVGVAVSFKHGTFGFNSGNTTGYQQIVIPASAFNTGSSLATSLRMQVSGGGGAIGWYIDNIILQAGGGGTTPPPAGGDFSTNTATSVLNEVVQFADTSGKLGKRTSGTGIGKFIAGVLSYLASTTVGEALLTLVNPSAIRFLRINADNSVTALDASAFRTAIGAGVGGGDASTNTAVSVDNEIALFSSTTGKILKRATETGLLKGASGVLSAATEGTDYLAPARIDDTAYNPTSWNGDTTHAPSKNAVRDQIETLLPNTAIDDTVYDATAWNGDTTHAPTKNAVRDKIESMGGAVAHIGGFTFSRGKSTGLTTEKITGYWTCPYAGNITAWNLNVDAGTITVKIWKVATGTAAPTNANSINTSGLSLSTGTAIHSTTLSDFTTTAVAAGDIFACEITAVAGVTDFGGSIEITRT